MSEVGDLAYELEARGVSPDGFVRVLELAACVDDLNAPPALTDVSHSWRIGACTTENAGRYNGDPIGTYLGRIILAWRKTEADHKEERRSR